MSILLISFRIALYFLALRRLYLLDRDTRLVASDVLPERKQPQPLPENVMFQIEINKTKQVLMPLVKGNMPDIRHLFYSVKLNKSIRYIVASLLQNNKKTNRYEEERLWGM